MLPPPLSTVTNPLAPRAGSGWLLGLALLLVLLWSCGTAGATPERFAGDERPHFLHENVPGELLSNAPDEGAAEARDCRSSAPHASLMADLVHGEPGDPEMPSGMASTWPPLPYGVPLASALPALPQGVREPLLRPPAQRA